MFDLRQRKNGNPLIVGHRGALDLAPGNTLPGLQAGLDAGADILELDVQLTADGEVVLFHDIDLEPITGLPGRVADHSLATLKGLDVGVAFGPEFAGTPMLTLAEALSWARDRVPLMIELKHEPPRDNVLEEKTAARIADYGMVEQVVIISFDQFALRRMKQFNANLAASFIYIGRLLDPVRQVDGLDVDALSPATNFLTREEVARIHAAGYACTPGGLWWDYPLLKEWGVDTVSANDPSQVSFDR